VAQDVRGIDTGPVVAADIGRLASYFPTGSTTRPLSIIAPPECRGRPWRGQALCGVSYDSSTGAGLCRTLQAHARNNLLHAL